MDTIFLDADFYNGGYTCKAGRQNQQINQAFAHGKYDDQRNHVNDCDQAEHSFLQTNPMVKDYFKPSF